MQEPVPAAFLSSVSAMREHHEDTIFLFISVSQSLEQGQEELNKEVFIYFLKLFFLAVLGLHCCVQAFSSCSERGIFFIVVCGLLIAVASLVVEHGL